ncbi:MAG: sugar phosphate isomerase/epimerase [Chloroflexi bacterium]|nr:sugar phosphate isomerase/epimerase [Chloroflexota bacterium]
MRVGIDVFTLRHLRLNGLETLDFVRRHGLEGAQFGSLTSLSPALDEGELQAVRQYADENDLYFEVSVPSPNPNLASPRVAELGGGSYRRGLERHIELAARLGCRHLHGALGSEKARDDPNYPWANHLADSTTFLRSLAPALRAHGCRIGLETHGDTTTFELVRLVEEIGPDVLGICLDTGNVLIRLEDPVMAAGRAAPYTIQTHTKDAILYFTDEGLTRQTRPAGQGAIDWHRLLPILGAANPRLTLSIEDHKWIFSAEIYQPGFVESHPDLTPAEFAQLLRFTWECQKKIDRGVIPHPEPYEAVPWEEEAEQRIDAGASYLKRTLGELRLHG